MGESCSFPDSASSIRGVSVGFIPAPDYILSWSQSDLTTLYTMWEEHCFPIRTQFVRIALRLTQQTGFTKLHPQTTFALATARAPLCFACWYLSAASRERLLGGSQHPIAIFWGTVFWCKWCKWHSGIRLFREAKYEFCLFLTIFLKIFWKIFKIWEVTLFHL